MKSQLAAASLWKRLFGVFRISQRNENKAWAIYLSLTATVILLFELTNYFSYYMSNFESCDPFSITIIYMWIISCYLFWLVQGSDPGYYNCVSDIEIAALDPKARLNSTENDNDRVNHFSNLERISKFCKAKLTRVASNVVILSLYLRSIFTKTERFDKNMRVRTSGNKDMLVFCNLCDMYLPLRSYHCKSCNRCVSTYDHHCHIIGTCIGERNHARFYLFILHFTYCTLNLFISILNQANFRALSRLGKQPQGNLNSKVVLEILVLVQYLLAAIVAFVSIGLICLLSYQSFLIATNILGHEFLAPPPTLSTVADPLDAPYSEGIILNLVKFVFIRDELFLNLFLNADWKPAYWSSPNAIDYSTVEISQNICRNKYYSCC